MRYLFDQHILLWARSAPDKVPEGTRATPQSTDNEFYVSQAMLWECAIKSSVGKLDLPSDFYRIVTSDYRILMSKSRTWRLTSLCRCIIEIRSTAC